MPEVKLELKNWESAREWVEHNAPELGLASYARIGQIRLYRSDVYLYFYTAGNAARLSKILFMLSSEEEGDYAWASWRPAKGEPPASLEALIGTETAHQANWNYIKKAAARFPAFSKAYDEIWKRLFPPYEHHQLHHDIGDYEEAISQDEAIIRCLKPR